MTRESCVHPPGWEKDVAGPLDLGQQVERCTDVFLRCGRTQWVVQILQSFEHPRLASTVLNVLEALKPSVASLLVLCQRRHHEFETRFPVGVHEPAVLLLEDGS